MDKVVDAFRWVVDHFKDNPGAVLTGALMAVVAFIMFKVGSFLSNF
jgi:hypothetical protein